MAGFEAVMSNRIDDPRRDRRVRVVMPTIGSDLCRRQRISLPPL